MLVLPIANLLVDSGEPLRPVQPNDRRFRAPAVCVGNRQAAGGDHRARLFQLVDDNAVSLARLAIGLDDLLACKERQVFAIGAVIQNVERHRQLVLHADGIVVITMAGRGVHKAGARVVGHVIARQQRHVEIPLAIGPFGRAEGVGTGQACQLSGGHCVETPIHRRLQTRGPQSVLGQFIGQDIAIPDGRPAFLRPPRHLVQPIRNLGPETDGAVLRDRPRGCRPDYDLGLRFLKNIHIRRHNRELHPDRVGLTVVVLDLGLGQRCLLNRRPHNGFRPLIEHTAHQEVLELLGNHTLRVEIHREVGLGPFAGHTQTLEFIALDVDPSGGEITAFLAEFHNRHRILVAAFLAVFLFDLPLDGQAVTIPTGDIACILAHHLLGAHDHILEDFVQRVSDMQMAIRIRRTVMQRKRRTTRCFLA